MVIMAIKRSNIPESELINIFNKTNDVAAILTDIINKIKLYRPILDNEGMIIEASDDDNEGLFVQDICEASVYVNEAIDNLKEVLEMDRKIID